MRSLEKIANPSGISGQAVGGAPLPWNSYLFIILLLSLFFCFVGGSCAARMVGHTDILEPRGSTEHLQGGLVTEGNLDKGVVTLKPTGTMTLGIPAGRFFHPPYKIELEAWLANRAESRFRIRFARVAGQDVYLYLKHNESSLFSVIMEAGVNEIELKAFGKGGQLAPRKVRLTISCSRSAWVIQTPAGSFTLKPASGVLDSGSVSVESLPHLPLHVDRMVVSGMDSARGTPISLGGNFTALPWSANLPMALGRSASDGWILLAAFLLFLVVGVMLDYATARLVARMAWPLSAIGWLILLFPSVLAVLFLIRAVLSLHLISLIGAAVVLLCARAVLLLRSGIRLFSPATSSERLGRRQRVQLMAALILTFVVFLVALEFNLRGGSGRAFWVTLMACGVPLLVFLLTLWRGSRHYPLAWFICAAQFFHMYWIVAISPDERALLPLLVVFSPWTMALVLELTRRPGRWRWVAVLLAALTAAGCFVGVELHLRPVLNETKLREAIHANSWEFTKTTSLLGLPYDGGMVRVSHDKMVRVAKPPGVYRIISLGSSSTFGTGSEDPASENYPVRLGQRLASRFAGTRQVEVINAGIPGSSFTILQVYLEEVLLGLSPDLVIIYFGGNGDTPDAQLHYKAVKAKIQRWPHIKKNKELWPAMQLSYCPEWAIRVFDIVTESRLVLLKILAVKEQKLALRSLTGAAPYQRRFSSEAAAKRVAEAAIKAGVKRGVKMLLIPEVTRKNAYLMEYKRLSIPAYQRIWRTLAKKYQGQGVFLSEIESSLGGRERAPLFVDDVHLTSKGYKYLAGLIEQQILAHGLIH